MTLSNLSAFRLGDIRGRYPDEINDAFAADFARAFARHYGLTGTVATGRDMRSSSLSLQRALNEGFMSAGLNVADVGLCPTELGYFASTRPDICAAVIVTASHNPPRYNGLKCVLRGGEAVTFDSGLFAVRELMRNPPAPASPVRLGGAVRADYQREYISMLASRFDPSSLNAGPVALNGLNGTAATLAVDIADSFDLPVTWFRREPGPIPDEGADPSKPYLVAQMREFMSGGNFSLGVAWDGDCDRCVFFDADGNLVPSYYIVGLLAAHFLATSPGRAIVFDTKLCWNTLDVIREHGGIPVPSETGHAFMKLKMRDHHAIYGGELSSHHFFEDFYYCDSGMFAWLTVMEVLARSGKSVAEMVAERRERNCCTPEISLAITDTDAAFAAITGRYAPKADKVERLDGISFEMPEGWRFSLCRSKTEALVRVNFESRGDRELLLERAAEVLSELRSFQVQGHDPAETLIIQ